MQRERDMGRSRKSLKKSVKPSRVPSRGNGAPKAAPRSSEVDLISRIVGWAIEGEELEERLVAWQRQGSINFTWLLGGWNAALAAAIAVLETRDWCFPGAREARVALWRGLSPVAYLTQLLGRAGPGGAGRTLPGMLSDSEHRVASVSGGPGAHLPQAVGAALAARHLGRKECALALAGSAAVDSPDFHVACNFATVFNAPVVLLIRGGGEWAPGTIAARGQAYALPAERVEAGDPLQIAVRVASALERGRAGEGPTLLELAPEPDEGAASGRLRGRLEELGAWSDAVEQRARKAARARWETALAEAQAGHPPRLESLTDQVFADDRP